MLSGPRFFSATLLVIVAWIAAASTAVADRLIISDASILTMEEVDGKPEILTGKTVIINGDSITSIIDTSIYEFVPGDQWIRAGGTWLMPALIHIDARPAEPEDLIELAAKGCVLARLPDLNLSFADRAGVKHWTAPHAPQIMQAYVKASIDEDRCSRIFSLSEPAGPSTQSDPAVGEQVATSPSTAPAVDPVQWKHLVAATRETAEAVHLEEKVGRIKPQFLADLILLNECPFTKVGPIRGLHALVRRGTYIYRSAIDVAVADAAKSRAAAAEYRAQSLSTRHFSEPTFRGTYLIRIDGLVNGCEHVEELGGADSLSQWSRTITLIPPATTETSITADLDGCVRSAEIVRTSAAQSFTVTLKRENDEVVAALHFKDDQPQEPLRAAMPADNDLSIDDLLTVFRMGRLESAGGRRHFGGPASLTGSQLIFGEGPIALSKFRIVRRGGDNEPRLDGRSKRREQAYLFSEQTGNFTAPNLIAEYDESGRPIRAEIHSEFGFILYERIAP